MMSGQGRNPIEFSEISLPTRPPPLRSRRPPTSPANPFVSIEYDKDLRYERAHGLLLVCIHRDIFLDYDRIIDIYASKYLSRTLLIDPLRES